MASAIRGRGRMVLGMTCPHCGKPINPAALLGAMGKGVRKQFSAAERKRRAARMAEARKARWRKPANEKLSDAP